MFRLKEKNRIMTTLASLLLRQVLRVTERKFIGNV